MRSQRNSKHLRPVKRTKLRLFIGNRFFTIKRYFLWTFGHFKFAKQRLKVNMECDCFAHHTPLIRKLKDVDMSLQYNKVENLKIAVKRLNKVVIYPGETFSYWKIIGKTSKWKGYKKGMVLFNGKIRSGVGGGLCQLSNLIYWMTLHTPLTVTERHRHSYDVFPDSGRTQPFGSGATCSYNYLDLMIRNDTEQPFQLYVEVADQDLVGCWKSDRPVPYQYEIYEKDHRMDFEYWGGYSRHNILFRKVYDANKKLIKDEYVTENHVLMMYQPFLCADVNGF